MVNVAKQGWTIDLLVITNLFLVIISWLVHDNYDGDCNLFQIIEMGLTFYLMRLLFSKIKKIDIILILGVCMLCLYESLLGLIQFVRFLRNNFIQFPCTGSFDNPGPYGCLLAICISILMSCYIFTDYIFLKKICVISIMSGLLMLPVTMSRSAFIAIGCSFFLLVYSQKEYRQWFNRYKTYFLVAIPLFLVFLYAIKKQSADGRLLMNKIGISMMLKEPIFGVGLGHYAGEFGKAQANYFLNKMQNNTNDLEWSLVPESERLVADCPTKAFNEYLQLGVETGVLSMLCFLSIVFIAILQGLKKKKCSWVYGLITLSIIAFFSYPYDFFLFSFFQSLLLAACCKAQISKPLNTLFALSFLILYSFIVPGLKRTIIKERRIASSVTEIKKMSDIECYDYIVSFCEEDNIIDIHDINYLFLYGKALSETGEYSKSDSILSVGASLSSDPMFWNVMGNNSFKMGNYQEAERCYKQAFYMVPNRLYPLYLLSKLYYQTGNYSQFIELVDRINTFIPKIESHNTKQMRNDINKLKEHLIQLEL